MTLIILLYYKVFKITKSNESPPSVGIRENRFGGVPWLPSG